MKLNFIIIFNITLYIIVIYLSSLAQDTNFDIEFIIIINTKDDALAKREKLIKKLFGSGQLPFNLLPDEIEKSIVDTSFAELPNLERIDKLTINMDWDLNSIAYHLIPFRSNNQMVICHQKKSGSIGPGKFLGLPGFQS